MFWPAGLLLQLNEDIGRISNYTNCDSFDFSTQFGCTVRHVPGCLSSNEILRV